MATIWLNGSFIDEGSACLSARDTGLLHGAGLFTTMRAYRGKVFRLQQHLGRLRRSSEVLFVPLQHKDEALASAVSEVLARNNLADARVRITLTRGTTQQDPLHGLRLEPTIFITAAEFEPYPLEYYQRGLTAVVLDQQKLNPYDVQAGHKTLNYFSRLFALREATQRGGGEALWFNVHNYLESGSTSNIFIAKGGRLLTPPTGADLMQQAIAAAVPYPKSTVIPGIIRQAVLELAERQGIEATPAAINISQLLEADEVFLTNSIQGIMPICRVERREIGNGRPGELTRRLSELYGEQLQSELA